MGEGYHNFHHQFPADYRNAYLWYQWDPTKWFIMACSVLRLANNLKIFSANEIEKAMLTMELKRLKKNQEMLRWPWKADELAVWSLDRCKHVLLSERAESLISVLFFFFFFCW